MNNFKFTTREGFALLITLVVISVVLAIGLTLLNITVKQFTLSTIIRDSEKAFHVANMGAECAEFAVRQNRSAFFQINTAAPVSCGGTNWSIDSSETDDNDETGTDPGQGIYYKRVYQFDNSSKGLCLNVSVYNYDVGSGGDGLINLTNEGLENAECEEEGSCTYIFSRGYNRSCGELSSLRVVQREITVDF